MTLSINIQNSDFVLDPSGAIWWESQQILLIADVHLGKVAHFRKGGFAVPASSSEFNYDKLDLVCSRYSPKTVYFLGDLFHSELNREWGRFIQWHQCAPKVVLIAGNHDVIAAENYQKLGVEVVQECSIGPFLLTHHPTVRDHFFNFCGHIHPAVRLVGKGRQKLVMPCFFRRPMQMILPAFGHFTGKFEMTPREQDCVYAITRDEVIEVCG
jgi:uncharacterized protein